MKVVFRQIKKSATVKNSITLIFGTVLAQLIPICLQPWLRRLYTPEEFGIFAIYTTLLGMVVSIATLKYETTIVLPKRDKDSINLVIGSILISVFISILLFIVLLIFGDTIIRYFVFPPAIKNWLFILPISVLFFSGYQTINYWLIRKKAYKLSAKNKVFRRSSEGLIQLLLGYYIPSKGLIIGTISGDITNFFIGIRQLIRTKFAFNHISFKRIIYNLGRYKQFPIFSAIPSFLNAISLTFPVLIVTKLFGEDITGQFNLSQMVLALPLALISVSVSQVLLQQTSSLINNKSSIYSTVIKTFKGLVLLSIPFILILYFYGESLFVLIFGKQWDVAGYITKILVLSYGFKFIVSPLSSIFISLEKIKISSIWQITYFIAIFSLLWVDTTDIKTFFTIYLFIDLIMYLIYFIMIFLSLKKYERQIVN